MKRTFWTRNLCIGVLMGLVMVLGVQEGADALTLRISSGDLVTVAPNQGFTLRFSVGGLKSPVAENPRTSRGSTTDIEYAAATRTRPTTPSPLTRNYTATTDADYTAGDTHYYTVTTTSTVDDFTLTTNTRNWLTESEAYDYNDESVSITSTPTLMKGNTAVSGATALIERHEESDRRLSSSITLTGSHPTPGAYDIVITDDTEADDFPEDTAPTTRASITFTVFVAGRDTDSPATAWGFTGLTSSIERYKVGGDDFTEDAITGTTGAVHAKVEYSVIEGSGHLYVQRGTAPNIRKTSAVRTIVTSDAAVVHLDMNGSTNKVRASLPGVAPVTATFIFGHPKVTIVSGNNQEGGFGGRLDDPLVVKVTDGRGRALSGLAAKFDIGTGTDAMFIPVPGTTVYIASAGTLLPEITAADPETQVATSTRPQPAADIIVQTDSRGEARTYFQLGTDASQTVTVTAGEAELLVPRNFRFTAEAGTRRPTLSILSGNNQRTDDQGDIEDPLIVVVRKDGSLQPDQIVTFRTSKGTITGHPLATNGTVTTTSMISGKRVFDVTDGSGRAQVTYYQDSGEGSDTVTAEISGPDYEKEVTFNINGGSSTRPPTRDPVPPTATNRIGISLSRSTGEPGDEITVTVRSDPTGRTVRLTSDDFANSLFSPQSETTPFESTLTLPDEEGEYTITAEGFPLEAATATVTVETGNLGRITISAIGQPSDGTQLFTITVRDTDGTRISSALTVRVSGSGFTARNVETSSGIGDVRLTLPTTSALYTLTASAANYESGTTQVRGTGSTPPPPSEPEEEPEEEPEVQEPDSISIVGPSQRTGTANSELEAALIVRILDEDDNPIEDARVIFRVRKGQGRLSQRGNGRAIADQTDRDGYARAEYTPMSASSTVEAQVRAVRDPVTFTITTDGSAPSTDTPDTGRDTPGTDEDTTTISPTVLIPPAQRPPMVWVDGGKIYSLIGTEVQEFIPNLNNVMNLTIGGGKVYWTEKTGASAGTINAASLDGSGKTELTSIRAIPIGIAVDTPNSKLYWTNSRGRIQSANLDGSGIQNVMQNIRNPNDLALAGGNVYWTESNHGSVRFVNLKGQKQVRVISTGDDPAGSLAIAGGKVYWTEKVGESGGTINVANLNGSGAKEIVSILATPVGIAVDTARSKLYWTNSRGRIQAASLDGSSIRNVVSGLGSPGEIVFSNSIKAPTTAAVKSTTTAAKGKYDINGDGSVDSMDVDILIIAVAGGVTTAKYDVNGDGKVNAMDVKAVNANLSKGAAGAPTLLGRKFSALEVERLQEQIDLLIATNDRSPAAMQTLIYLQQLIVMARPEKTQLLSNYPNPFNPETWMPYELATDTDVRITIYTSTGVVVRVLTLGHQTAGYYTDRERAAYWDGRNASGEQVASGIYFYQLETDEMSALRKMVIVK